MTTKSTAAVNGGSAHGLMGKGGIAMDFIWRIEIQSLVRVSIYNKNWNEVKRSCRY
jgi:hypothetical protein